MIKSELEYEKALKRIEKLQNVKKGSKEFDEVMLLAEDLMKWEEEHINFPDPTTNDMITFAQEQFGLEIKVNMKGYDSIIKYSYEDKCFHGKIDDITDLILFEGKSIDKVCLGFVEAVNDYLELNNIDDE